MPHLRLIFRQLWTLCVNHYTGGALIVVFGILGFSTQWFSPGVSSRYSVFVRLLASGMALVVVRYGLQFFLKTWPSGAVIDQAIELVFAFTLLGVGWLCVVGFFFAVAWGALSHAWDSPGSLVERVLAIVFAVFFAGCGVSVLRPLFRYISRVYRTQGLYPPAKPFFETLIFWEQTVSPTHPFVVRSLNNLAQLYIEHGQYAPAEPLLKRALALREKAFGPDHPDVATSLEKMANLYRKTDRNTEAEALEKRAQAIRAIVR